MGRPSETNDPAAGPDWADSEDHDFLNDFVGQRIDAIETGTTDGGQWLIVRTSRGRALRIAADMPEYDECALAIDEP